MPSAARRLPGLEDLCTIIVCSANPIPLEVAHTLFTLQLASSRSAIPRQGLNA